MERSIHGNSVIINEAHSFPVELIGKRKQLYVLALLVIFTCFKSEAVEAQIPQIMVPTQSEVKKDASWRTARLEYKLARERLMETGIFLSADSAALISPGQATRYRAGNYDENSRSFRVEFDGLEPDSRYFYKIFIRDKQNKDTWSEITPIHTPGFNIRWSGAQKWMTASNTTEIMLTGESVDMVLGYYRVFFGGKPCELLRISSSPNSTQSYYTIRLPRNSPPGIHRIVMMYKKKIIFDRDIEVL
jgi:hypothetical protein